MGLSDGEKVISIHRHVYDIRCWQTSTKSGLCPNSGDWLQASPIASVGLLLSDEEIRLVMAYRLGTRACFPYTCACGKAVHARGLHGLSCRRSTPRHQRHSMINDIIWRAIMRAKIPTHKEPTGLIMQNGKCPYEATLIPWSRGRALAWDVTIPTHMQRLIFNTRHLKPAEQRYMQRTWNVQNTENSTPCTYSSQLPSTLPAHGINKQWIW